MLLDGSDSDDGAQEILKYLVRLRSCVSASTVCVYACAYVCVCV